MLDICDRIKKKKLTVRETESLILKISNKSSLKSKRNNNNNKSKLLIDIENKLIHKYGTKASIHFNKNSKGKIVLEYYSKDDLERILDLLMK